MHRDILIPLDGSALAETVLPHAIALAQATNSTLTLLRVIAESDDAEHPLSEQRRRGLIYVAFVADRLRALDLRVQTAVVHGDPAQHIIAHAAERAAGGMLAMTTHGRSGPRRWFFGSVAEKVLCAVSVPVLLVRRHEQHELVFNPVSYRNLLVPLDGSNFSEQALDEAHKLAHMSGATLHLLSVVDETTERISAEDTAAAEVGIVPAWMLAEAHAHTQWIISMLNQTAQRLRSEGLTVETIVMRGNPAEKILDVAADEDVDLVVMATHGWTGLKRIWFGSVAMEVIQRIDRAVLLVRPE